MSNTIGMLTQQMEAANEDSKSKARKYECELNQ